MGIYRRTDGRSPFWQYEFELPTGRKTADGKRERKRFRGSTGHASERDAKAFERTEKDRQRIILAAELEHEAAPDTVDSVFTRYWTNHGHKLKWGYTVQKHMRDMMGYWGPAKPLIEIGNAEVAAMLEAYAKQTTRRNRDGSLREAGPVTDGTLNRRLAVFKRIHNVARVKWELPVKAIDWEEMGYEEPEGRLRHITREQARILVDALPLNIKLMAAWTFATGCRRNETETLTWARINYETGKAEVFTKSKKKNATRFVTLGPAALDVLAQCDPARELVFDATNLRRAWATACKKAGISDFRWHDMRHTFATWVGSSGTDIAVIRELLGHSDVRVTEKYRHVIGKEVQKAVASVPVLLESNIEPMQKARTESTH